MQQTSSLKIDLMKWKSLYFFISLLIIIPGIYSLIRYGLRPSIDFTGGSLIELQFSSPTTSQSIRQNISQDIHISSIQSSDNNTYLIRTKPITKDQNESLKTSLASTAGQLQELRFETVGPVLGQELVRKTIGAISIAAFVIMLFVTTRFNELKYGVCAIIAMFHDTIILLGVFSLLGHFLKVEIDTLFVTAVLTTLSFSVHDTIVVYDRIRESLKTHKKTPFVDLVNKSVAETLSRSVNNSMTIIFMLLALWLMGGDSTKWFVFALLIGTIAGTYSSTFTAAPLLIIWEKIFKKKN